MNVTLQYFDSCPHWKIADQRLRDVISSNELDVDLAYQLVESAEEAERFGFHGSPSILIDGVDPFANEDTQVGYACRVYSTDTGDVGSPSIEQIAVALGV